MGANPTDTIDVQMAELGRRTSSQNGLLALMRYTKEALEDAVVQCRSFSQVAKYFGCKPIGGNVSYIAKLIRKHSIDISHFTGRRSNCGPNHRGGAVKKTHQEVLVLERTPGRKEATGRLRTAMLGYGFTHLCEVCSQPPSWNGRPMVLQIDHKNGNPLDNRPKNLRFICPNCHSQTGNWGFKNAGVAKQ